MLKNYLLTEVIKATRRSFLYYFYVVLQTLNLMYSAFIIKCLYNFIVISYVFQVLYYANNYFMRPNPIIVIAFQMKLMK